MSTSPNEPNEPDGRAKDTPGSVVGSSRTQRRERLRPVELLVFAAVLAVFTGLIVIVTLRNPLYALIAFGVVFTVSLVILAMFALGVRPSEEELKDLRDQDDAH